MRIPLAIRYPGVLPEGGVCSQLISNVDLAPTVLEAAGAGFRKPVDGRSLLSLFRENGGEWRTAVYAETYGHAFPHVGKMAVEGRIKYVYHQGDIEELYHLDQDPFEMHNLSQEERHSGLLEHMRMVCRKIDPEKRL